MHSCPTCQAQLLDYLYDLLDEAERRALQEHLDACPACRAALDKAREQQRLLAAAARMEFPQVRFLAPSDEATAAVLPMAAPAVRRVRPWRRWAAAAAVLLALGGTAVPGWRVQRDYAELTRTVETAENAMAQADRKAKELAEKTRQLPEEERQKIEEVRTEERSRRTEVAVVGPATAQAGAPNTFEVRTNDLNNRPVAAEVQARLFGTDRRPVLDGVPVVKAGEGRYDVNLPPNLTAPPDNRLTLVVSAKREDGVVTVGEEFGLAAPAYATHLETDKPMYQPGEVVHYRSLTLDRFSMKPAEENLRLTFELLTPAGGKKTLVQGAGGLRDDDGAPVLGPDKRPIRGVGAGEFLLDPKLEGGEYTLVCREDNRRFPEQRRKFIVNNYPKPQLSKKLDFNRSTYGPGDEVAANCKALRADGEPVRNQPVEATVLIDDKAYGADGKETQQPMRLQTDDQGGAVVRFRLPAVIERGEASLAVTFLGKPVEAIARRLPIVLKKLDVAFYPEGGDLAADLPNRVYFQARTPLGKPADLTGRLLEDGKPLPVTAETLHDDHEPGANQGMGEFGFTPKSGKKYALEIDSPVGITAPVALPDVKDGGVALSVAEGVTGPGEPIKATVRGTAERERVVALYCRGRLLQSVQLPKGQTEAVLNPEPGASGVCRVTVFEGAAGPGRQELQPVAERLIYRRPAERLAVKIQPDHASYVPGQRAALHVETDDETGKPAPSVMMLAVTDKSVVTLADEKTDRSMPTQFLLASEVQRPEDLEYADFLLGPQPKAAEALDLLLGVQGWRRFAKQDPARLQDQNADKEEADRLLMATGQSPPRGADLDAAAVEKAHRDATARYAELKEQISQTRAASSAATAEPAYTAAVARLASYDRALEWAGQIGVPLVSAALLTVALVCLVLGLRRRLRQAIPWYAAAAAGVLLMIVAVQFYRTAAPRPAGQTEQQVALLTDMAEPPPMPDAKPSAPTGDQGAAELAPNAAADAFLRAGAAQQGGLGGAALDKSASAGGPGHLPAPAAPTAQPPPGPGGAPAATAPALGAANKPGDLRRAPNEYAAARDEAKAGANAGFRPDVRAQLNQDVLMEREKVAGEVQLRKDLALKKADALTYDDRAPKKAQLGARALKDADKDEAPRALEWQKRVEDYERRHGPADGKELLQHGDAAPMLVREYAHRREPGAVPELRSDFAETLYWHPVLVLPDGKADVSFDLCDSTTTFQATAFAHTTDGRLGAATADLEVRTPFALHPAAPVEVTASDTVGVPLTVANDTPDRRDVRLTVQRHDNLNPVGGPASDRLAVDAGKAARPVYRFRPTAEEGDAVLEFAGKTEPFAADMVRTRIHIAPEGFPVSESRSDVLEGSASQSVTLPDSWVKGTLQCRVQVFPSTLADLQGGLESLLREPNGCFEQTSTSNYPNLLILDYLKESGQAKPEVERRARELLARGYQKLTSFECTKPPSQPSPRGGGGQVGGDREGYEWFGGTAPPHEALTAYGLLEFRDMARVQDVDPAMLKRTKDYLLSRRDGKGGFLRNPGALDSFGRAPDDVTNAYIVWALTESGKDDDLTAELKALAEQAKTSKDPYFLSLVANGLINRARTDEAAALLQTVAGLQKEDGHLDAEKTSITGSGGRDLQIETTALAVLGWLKANPGAFNQPLQRAIQWIGKQRGGYGGFGSTQSTILALKALIAYTKANKRTAEGGELRLFVGDKEAGKLAFPAGASEVLMLELKDAETLLRPGRNDVRVEITGKNVFPYTLAWTYQTLKPVSAEDCPVRLTAELSQTEVREGDLVRLNVALENVSGKGQGMATAVVGLPGGLSLPEDMKQLKQDCRPPVVAGSPDLATTRPLVSAFEVRGRELVLYWRDLAPGQKIEVPVDLIARVPGEYTGPASRGYLYYNADHKHWVDPLHIRIAERAE